ncbi:N-acetylgalactosamine kinase isoform X2 [Cephus cinctus]|nr:N-acetylgalactosamine kinase isoform X2 [Cephus cinctus]
MSKGTNGKAEIANGNGVPILKAHPDLQARLTTLADDFKSRFQEEPEFFVRVPGRVNLIGEHVDYCGYSVCPMAIEQDILLAVASSKEANLRLINFDPKYPDFQWDFRAVRQWTKTGNGAPLWHEYFLCGVKGAMEVIPEGHLPTGVLVNLSGNIPPGSGLSSSSALVSAAALATMHISKCQLSKESMANLTAKAERYIGTEGGGMDQAIAFLGKQGSAKLIEFNPLRATDVTLPESAVFVIAHSLASHNKASTDDYNLRVAECRMAAQVIAKKRSCQWEYVKKLSDVQKQIGKNLEEMSAVAMEELHEEPYTFEEICNILETTQEHMKTASLTTTFSTSQNFKLQQRALHVFQEAARVQVFRDTCEEKKGNETEKLRCLGSLMSKSHASLRQLYECSHPNVDALVDDAVSCGALGARLTGAGWGGCVVAITTEDKAREFMEALENKFYKHRKHENTEIKDLLFVTQPNQGAAIYTV